MCPGSLGSSEQLPDSDSELDDRSRWVTWDLGMKRESQGSGDDEQLSCRDSLDLSGHTDPEQDTDQARDNPEGCDHPPALPDHHLTAALAKLNVNQSNNNNPGSPVSGLSLSRLCGGNLALTRNKDSEPELV